ncbi:MAG: hypothetical protein WCK03_03795, partial [Candidatus Taylorbacteria bacterium]
MFTNKFFVIDQNHLSYPKHGLESFILKSSPDVYFVITDYAFLEMVKPLDMDKNIEKTLQIIKKYSNRIWHANSANKLTTKEIKKKKAVQLHDIIEVEMRGRLRYFLVGYKQKGNDSPAYKEVKTAKSIIVPKLKDNILDEKLGYKVLYEMHTFLDNNVIRKRNGVVNRFQNCKLNNEDLLSFVKAVILFETDILNNLKFTKDEIDKFIIQDTCVFRWLCALALLALQLRSQGIENFHEDKSPNELLDIDYTVIASYGQGLLSDDQKLN